MTDEFVRKLPFSMIAEQSLLGSVLIDPQALNDVAEIITAQDFYRYSFSHANARETF